MAWNLSTIITGTILATGKTFTHGLGTTPDVVLPIHTGSAATAALFVAASDSQTFRIGGAIDGLAFQALVSKLHSIIK